MKKMDNKKVKRRNFFTTIFKGAAGLYLLNLFPVLIASGITKESDKKKQFQITVHPSAVKRNKRG